MMMGGWGHGPGLWQNNNFWWVGLISGVIHLLFWLGVFYLAYRVYINYTSKKQGNSVSDDQALEILRQRYAKGEIDTEEFNLRKTELQKPVDKS